MKISNLDFKLIDPVEASEEWALVFGSSYYVVEIYIDGVELCDIVRPIEEAYIRKNRPDFLFYLGRKQHYGHLCPKVLYDNLIHAEMPYDPYFENEECLLLCCAECGIPECWSFSIQVKEDEEFIYWYDFEHLFRDLEYGLSYRFEKKQYEAAMRKLRRFISQQKR